MIDGALLLDKPVGASSNRALQEAKQVLGARKAGHAGTLDPLASGLLILLFGEATKLAATLLEDDKEYVATLKLGERTSTGDAEGEVVERGPAGVPIAALAEVVQRFQGELEQVPPMHSALKRGGVPLYRLARKGENVDRAPRRVLVHELRVVDLDGARLTLRVRCSKGTYVRTLAEDIGAALGTCAHLSALRRTASGRFRVDDAISPEALAAEGARRVISLAGLVGDLPRAELDEAEETRFRNGQVLEKAMEEGLCAVFGARGEVIGLATAKGRSLRPLRLFARVASG